MTKRILQVTLPAVFLCATALAADWPNPTGPHANSMLPEERLREDLQANPPKVAWKFPLLYRGYGAPVIDKGTVFILDRDPLIEPDGQTPAVRTGEPSADGADKDDAAAKKNTWASQPDRKTYLRSISLNTGKENWSSSWIDEGSCRYDGIRSWPVFDDRRIFLIDHGGTLRCFDKATHREVWKSTFGRKATGRSMDSYTKSPVLYRDTIIVTRTDWQDWAKGAATNTVMALDAATGAERWSVGVPGCHSVMGTPALVTLGGTDQIVIHGDRYVQVGNRPGPVVGLAARDGRLLWRVDEGPATEKTYFIPMVIAPDRILVGDSGRFIGGGMMVIEVKNRGGAWTAKPVFHKPGGNAFGMYHQAMVHGGRIYHMGGSGSFRATGLDGQDVWRARAIKGNEVRLIGIGDAMILVGDTGLVSVYRFAHGGDTFETDLAPVWSGQVLEGNEVWAPAAWSDGRLVARDLKNLVCTDFRKP